MSDLGCFIPILPRFTDCCEAVKHLLDIKYKVEVSVMVRDGLMGGKVMQTVTLGFTAELRRKGGFYSIINDVNIISPGKVLVMRLSSN